MTMTADNFMWNGRRLVDLSRDELIEVVLFQYEMFMKSAAAFDALRQTNLELAAFNEAMFQAHGGRA